MQRILVGGVAALLLVVSGLWFWPTQANQTNLIPAAPPPDRAGDPPRVFLAARSRNDQRRQPADRPGDDESRGQRA